MADISFIAPAESPDLIQLPLFADRASCGFPSPAADHSGSASRHMKRCGRLSASTPNARPKSYGESTSTAGTSWSLSKPLLSPSTDRITATRPAKSYSFQAKTLGTLLTQQ